jgi:hypothetical protein
VPLIDRHDVVWRRLRNQRLVGKPFRKPTDVVAHHLAMQSQDYAGARWAVGQRLTKADDTSVERAFDQGKILRTHVLRPTWHFVAPADVRWLQELTAPRVRQVSTPYFRKFGLDTPALKRSRRVLERALDGRALTRDELGEHLRAAKLPSQGEGLAYQLIAAELDAVVVSGPRRGKQHSYVLLEQRVPPTPRRERDEALAELALRYLQSHGPALPQDLAWWSGLTMADAKRGIAACGAALATATIDGKVYYLTPPMTAPREPGPVVHLLPNYDEQLIAYRYRQNAIDGATSGKLGVGDGIFDGHFLMIDGLLAGSWRRELQSSRVSVGVTPLRKLTRPEREGLAAAAARFAAFVGLELSLSVKAR